MSQCTVARGSIWTFVRIIVNISWNLILHSVWFNYHDYWDDRDDRSLKRFWNQKIFIELVINKDKLIVNLKYNNSL